MEDSGRSGGALPRRTPTMYGSSAIEGFLYKKNSTGFIKSFKKRYFHLNVKSRQLSYYRSSDGVPDAKTQVPDSTIDIPPSSTVIRTGRTGGGRWGFTLQVPGRSYDLQCDTYEDLMMWFEGLKKAAGKGKEQKDNQGQGVFQSNDPNTAPEQSKSANSNAGSGGGGGSSTTAGPVCAGDTVVALYDFEAEADATDELSFSTGDVIAVLSTPDEEWWMGKIGLKSGLFPSSYVEKRV